MLVSKSIYRTATRARCVPWCYHKKHKQTMKANLNGKDVDFIIDTGAAVSAISESTYTEIGKPKQLPND